jgi:hypothetical protein
MADNENKGDTPKPKAEGRFARHRRVAQEIYAEPRSIAGFLRDGFVSVWVSHGAGFYGLGWIVTFVVLEVNLFSGELLGSDGVADFIGSQLFEYVLRVGFMSFVNSLLAAIWPVYVLEWFDVYGVVLFIGGYYGFEKLLKPVVEGQFPELRKARQAAEAKSNRAEAKSNRADAKSQKKRQAKDKKRAAKKRD